MESRQYQFRAKPDLEAGIRSVWNKNRNVTENLTVIIEAGVKSLLHTKQLKAKYRGEGDT